MTNSDSPCSLQRTLTIIGAGGVVIVGTSDVMCSGLTHIVGFSRSGKGTSCMGASDWLPLPARWDGRTAPTILDRAPPHPCGAHDAVDRRPTHLHSPISPGNSFTLRPDHGLRKTHPRPHRPRLRWPIDGVVLHVELVIGKADRLGADQDFVNAAAEPHLGVSPVRSHEPIRTAIRKYVRIEFVKTIRVGESDWLVLDDAIQPRFLIHHGPTVNKITRETLMMYRVDHWVLKRSDRWPLGYYETLADAQLAAESTLGAPKFLAPVTDPHGQIVTPEEQRERWQAGLDPRTGPT